MTKYGFRRYPGKWIFGEIAGDQEAGVVTAMITEDELGDELIGRGWEPIFEMFWKGVSMLRDSGFIPSLQNAQLENLALSNFKAMELAILGYLNDFVEYRRMLDWFRSCSICPGHGLIFSFGVVPLLHPDPPTTSLILQTIAIRWDRPYIEPLIYWAPADPPFGFSGLLGDEKQELEQLLHLQKIIRQYCWDFVRDILTQPVGGSLVMDKPHDDVIRQLRDVIANEADHQNAPFHIRPIYVSRNVCIVCVSTLNHASGFIYLFADKEQKVINLHQRTSEVTYPVRVSGYINARGILEFVIREAR